MNRALLRLVLFLGAVLSLCAVYLALVLGTWPLWLPVLLNIVVVAGVYLVHDQEERKKSHGMFFCAALWPGLGLALLAFSGISVGQGKVSAQLKEYESYIHSSNDYSVRQLLGRIDAREGQSVLSADSLLYSGTPERKKEEIIRVDQLPEARQIAFLRQAITDPDNEVRHYAAVMLARFGQRYDQIISALTAKAKHDREAFDELLDVYRHLLESGYLEGSLKKSYADEFQGWLELAEKEGHISFLHLDGLLDLYLAKREFAEAEKLIERAANKAIDSVITEKMWMRYYFARGQFDAVRELALSLRHKKRDMDLTYAGIIEFWVQGGK